MSGPPPGTAKLKKMFSALTAALLTQQVLTQTPCYAALVGLCSDPPKHTMIVIPAPSLQDGWNANPT